MELELRHLIGYARRWWWLLILLPALAGGVAHTMSSRQQPLYSATATLLIKPAQNSNSSNDFSSLQSGARLATTYQQLVVTEPVLDPVAQQLGQPYTVALLKGKVSASTVRDTQLLKISVSDTDPQRAADIANAVAAQFQTFIANQELAGTSSSRAGLQSLIDTTQQQVNETQQQINQLSAATLDDAGQAKLDGLRTRLSQLQQSLASLIVQQQDLDLQSSSLQNQARVYVPATAPTAPYAPRVFFYTVLAAFVGGLIAIGAVVLIEYLDNTVKAATDYQALVGAPMLSVVGLAPNVSRGKDQLFVLSQPTSSPAEAIRLLRTNIEFAATTREIEAMMVTSALPGEGKSTVTANLAVALAQAGYETIVVDADLRRPSQHRIFDVRNDKGLTTLLARPGLSWIGAATEIGGVPNLWLVPSGPLPPNPADLLSLGRFAEVIREMTQAADIVLVDTSPVLAVSDPLVVSSTVRDVVVVSRSARTRTDALRRAVQLLPKEPVRLLGVVVNQQSGKDSSGYYYYYSGYYGPSDGDAPKDGSNPPPVALPRRLRKHAETPSGS